MGSWNVNGGKLGEKENPDAGVLREIHEESGLYVFSNQLISLVEGGMDFFDQGTHFEMFVYACWLRARNGIPRNREPDTMGVWRWKTVEELLRSVNYESLSAITFMPEWIVVLARLTKICFKFDCSNQELIENLSYLDRQIVAWMLLTRQEREMVARELYV